MFNPEGNLETKIESQFTGEPDPLIEQIIGGRFLVKEVLDRGGIGVIYLALDLKVLTRKVVIKVLQETHTQDLYIRRKFEHEIEALSRLDHPGIVGILDAGLLPNNAPYLVMPYLPGRTLKSIIKESKNLPLAFCARIIENLTDALSAVHAAGLIHRDVKPENIMLTENDDGSLRIRLIDFGIVRIYDSQIAPVTQVSMGIGTLFYVAPEQLRGVSEQTPAVDIFSCGTVFYEILTGERPFAPKTKFDMEPLQKEGVKRKPSELRPEIPEETDRLIIQSLAYDPEQRPVDIRAFGKQLSDSLRISGQAAEKNETGTNYTAFMSATENLAPANQAAPAETKKKNLSSPVFILLGAIAFAFVLLLVVIAILLLQTGRPEPTKNTQIIEPAKVEVEKPPGNSNTGIIGNSNTDVNAKPETILSNELSYYLEVQKMRDGKPYEEPFRATGQEILENGYKVQIFLESQIAGNLYVFGEGKDNRGEIVYKMLYPNPKQNSGLPDIEAKQPIALERATLGGTKGEEVVWILWSAESNTVLEDARQNALKSNDGKLADSRTIEQFQNLLQNNSNNSFEVKEDTEGQQTLVRGTKPLLVHRLVLKHR